MPPRLKIILSLAFLLRSGVAVTAWLSLHDPTAYYAKDTWSYLQPALELVGAGSFTTYGVPELFRTPGYSVLLSLGASVGAVEAVTLGLQILLSCLTVYFVYRLAEGLYADARVAGWSGLAMSVEPLSIISSNWLLSDTLFTALLAAALYCLLRFTRERRGGLLYLAAVLLAVTVYVRPIGYFFPVVVMLVLLSWACYQRERQMLQQAVVFGVLAATLIGAWQIRNALATGYRSFSSAVDYNLYFHQVAGLKAKQQQVPFYEVMEEMGFYSHEQYLRYHPDQQSWTLAEQYDFMRREGLKATWADPIAAANIYLHGLVISLFDPGASEYLRLFRLYPKSGKILNGVVSEGIVTTALKLIATNPLLCGLTGLFGAALLLYYALTIVGLRQQFRRSSLSLWLLLATGLYFLALSGGTIAASRFRLPVMLVVCILAGQGLSIALSRIHLWKEQWIPGLPLGEANLTRHT